jgi:hypothetical protein
MKYLKLFLYSAALMLAATGCCYRMPTEYDYCLIPSTNNPDFTHEANNRMPGVGY